MKYLIVLALICGVFWLWRHNRLAEKGAVRPPRSPASAENGVTEMVACDVCHVHLPKSDALIGDKGIYCSDAHRRQAGG